MLGTIGLAAFNTLFVILLLAMAFLLTVLFCSLHEEERRRTGKVAFPLSQMSSHIFFKVARGTRTQDQDQEYQTYSQECDGNGFRQVITPSHQVLFLPKGTLVKYSSDQNRPFF
ncbi:MAG: hypothetical protein NT170_00175 [Candidatus Moranbacteria bacterium]|nr:hypothetical protein [Candidatus Moranbacteria bacterium]